MAQKLLVKFMQFVPEGPMRIESLVNTQFIGAKGMAKKGQEVNSALPMPLPHAQRIPTTQAEPATSGGGVSVASGNLTPFMAQQLAQAEDATDLASESRENTKTSAADEFRKFLGDTPEERIRHQMLAQFGLTEEELAAMPPEERKKIEDMIKDKLKESLKRETGIVSLTSPDVINV